MVLKLYGFTISANVTRVAVVLLEKNIPYEFIAVDPAAGEHKIPEYLAKHPFGEVPYIDDDGFILYESWAIARYICQKYPDRGPNLIPQDLKKRALFEQAASIEQSNFVPHSKIIIWEGMVKEMLGQKPDQGKLEAAKTSLGEKLDVYEHILSKTKYLAGDEITLADLIHLGIGAMLPAAGCNALEDHKRPNLVRWYNDLKNRPAWQAVLKYGPKGSP